MAYNPETLSLALELVLGIWDRGVALLKSGRSSRGREFREIAEPLYRELQPIAEDYFKLFVGTYQDIQQSRGRDFGRALTSLKERRELLRSARIQVRSRADELAGLCKDQALADFLWSVVSFIESPQKGKAPPPKPRVADKPRSRPASLVEQVDVLASRKASKSELLAHVGAAVEEMERSWADVGATYARVQAHYLGTIR